MRTPEQSSNSIPKQMPGVSWIADFEWCEDIEQLRRVMEEINRNQYQLVSVTQDSDDVYTVFFRRSLLLSVYDFSFDGSLLANWVLRNKTRFYKDAPDKFLYGVMDKKYVYITNRAFHVFCNLYHYDVLDFLRYLHHNGYIESRKDEWHGGHYKSKRICGNVESCVWLKKDKLFIK